MNLKTFKKYFKMTPASRAVLVKGIHGIGKTQIVKQLAHTLWGFPEDKIIVFQCSQISDVGDFIGLPSLHYFCDGIEVSKDFIDKLGDDYKNHKIFTRTQYNPPFWFHPDEDVCIVLDEINRGKKAITDCAMQLTLEKRILDMQLTQGSRVIAMMNPSMDGTYDLEQFDDPAKRDRFSELVLEVTPEEWLYWAKNERYRPIHPLILDYIGGHKTDLDPFGISGSVGVSATNSEEVGPSRRSWDAWDEFFVKGLEEDAFVGKEGLAFLEESCATYVGDAIANNFKSFYSAKGNQITSLMVFSTPFNEKWKTLARNIRQLCDEQKTEGIKLGASVVSFLSNHEDEMADENNQLTEKGLKYAKAFYYFMKSCNAEVRADVYTNGVKVARNANSKWNIYVNRGCEEAQDLYYAIVDPTLYHPEEDEIEVVVDGIK